MLDLKTVSLLFVLPALIGFQAEASLSEAETGSKMAVRSIVMGAASIGGAGAYAESERRACKFSSLHTVPRCINSIFGLLQLELSLQGLNNSKSVALQLMGEGSLSLSIDLKEEGFCVNPLKDSCQQDEIDQAVVGLYSALKNNTESDYTKAIANIQKKIDGKLSEFEMNGYVIDKVARKVTPPMGAPQNFTGGKTVSARLFKKSNDKFSKILNKNKLQNQVSNQNSRTSSRAAKTESVFSVEALLKVARNLTASGVLSNRKPASDLSKLTSNVYTTRPSFLTGLTDAQREVAVVAPQGVEVFGSVSRRYKKIQKTGDFIQP